jgi:hypothetical protein
MDDGFAGGFWFTLTKHKANHQTHNNNNNNS